MSVADHARDLFRLAEDHAHTAVQGLFDPIFRADLRVGLAGPVVVIRPASTPPATSAALTASARISDEDHYTLGRRQDRYVRQP